MSISTQGGNEQRRPNVVTVGGKPGGKTGAKTAPQAAKSAAGGGPRKPITPVKVNQGRNWGPIALFTVVGVLAAGIIGWGAWAAFKPGGAGYGWESKANSIEGIENTRTKYTSGSHTWDPVKYDESPAVGGTHSYVWQNCSGNIYDQPIPNEHAVHSLEHGAVWITYNADLPADQVEKLVAKVRGKDFMMISPVKGLTPKVSNQAWGFQLKVDSVDDPRIDEFITALRKNATMEPEAGCSGGNTATGDAPLTQEQYKARQGG